jgi:hypothetical protein
MQCAQCTALKGAVFQMWISRHGFRLTMGAVFGPSPADMMMETAIYKKHLLIEKPNIT